MIVVSWGRNFKKVKLIRWNNSTKAKFWTLHIILRIIFVAPTVLKHKTFHGTMLTQKTNKKKEKVEKEKRSKLRDFMIVAWEVDMS